ncbi:MULTISPECIES: fatty acyl-AMP ligase [unclassified Streptomyces]|uniref:fatty acyl-AMP ligase n=1 Tax=unclassified Streptomyces TaxID=2593676 RepID=UPI001BEC16B8|nr:MULTISPECIES: fatty acyl-AMP ligase [unclassified Streptomyces]MBT2408799.1 fatty acyl-AMP ligase [Streptomyces sp. ISL-21]MBT2612427.1 fatty acyl-AMP ligase [Streptomyces sp. ISL-87]
MSASFPEPSGTADGDSALSAVPPHHPVARLRSLAHDRPHDIAYRFVGSRGGTVDEPITWTYAELDRRVRAAAAVLQSRCAPASRVALVCAQGPQYVTAFLACLYAGVVAVPLCEADSAWGADRLSSVLPSSGVQVVLTDDVGDADVRRVLAGDARFAGYEVIRTNEVPREGSRDWLPVDLVPEAVAYLQYTSGSTSAPRGVRITHGNIAQAVAQVDSAFRIDPSSVAVSWLPLYHDLGLMLGVLGPLGLGATCVLMGPTDFIRRPLTYLRAIDRWRGTITSGPCFNLDLCVDRVRGAALDDLDLSSLRVLGNGGEQVRASALRRFSEHFARCGFRPEAHTPSYGLAEATLVVTCVPVDEEPRVLVCDREALVRGHAVAADAGKAPEHVVERVSCGVPVDQRVCVTDPSGRVLPDRRVGEIWTCGGNVSPGYAEETTATGTFHDRPMDAEGAWLRTGDLGFLADGQLYVTGRVKDVVIINGRNHWPTDLEATVGEAVTALRKNRIAAFRFDVTDRERLVMVAEVDPRAVRAQKLTDTAVEHAVRTALMVKHGIELHELVPVRPGSLPVTSSGKLRRRACREAYESGRLVRAAALD